MSINSEILNVLFMIGTVIGAGLLVRYQVGELLKNQKTMFKKMDELNEKATLSEQDLRFLKREVDDLSSYKQRKTILEQTTAHHIDLIGAEQKFVTRREFELIVDNMDRDLKEVKSDVKKLLKLIAQEERNEK